MRFIEMQGFSVRPDKAVKFQQWVIANQERIKRAYPEGSELGGTYATVSSSDKNGGGFYWLDILGSYGALDQNAASAKDPASGMAKVMAEFLGFVDLHGIRLAQDLTVRAFDLRASEGTSLAPRTASIRFVLAPPRQPPTIPGTPGQFERS